MILSSKTSIPISGTKGERDSQSDFILKIKFAIFPFLKKMRNLPLWPLSLKDLFLKPLTFVYAFKIKSQRTKNNQQKCIQIILKLLWP